MNRDKEKQRADLQKLLDLKAELLSTRIAKLQFEEDSLRKRIEFQDYISNEWLEFGVLSEVECISESIQRNGIAIEKIQTGKREHQYEKLNLKVAREQLSI
jgi:hypothetical protein